MSPGFSQNQPVVHRRGGQPGRGSPVGRGRHPGRGGQIGEDVQSGAGVQPGQGVQAGGSVQGGKTPQSLKVGGPAHARAGKVGNQGAKAQRTEPMPKMVVEVNDLGLVDNASSGKNAWHKDWRGLIFRWCDLSKVKWEDQDAGDVATAISDMNARWEYKGTKPRVMESLEHYGRVILKTERHRLKKKWLDRIPGSADNTCPPEGSNLTDEQWCRLVGLFESEVAKVKSEQMTDARGEVRTSNPFGRSGAAGAAAKQKAIQGSTPSKGDMKALREGKSGASEISEGTRVKIFSLDQSW